MKSNRSKSFQGQCVSTCIHRNIFVSYYTTYSVYEFEYENVIVPYILILPFQLFKGSFYYCEGPNLKNITTKSDCLESKENNWLNRKYNFDDLGQALMSLFVLSSKDGWVNIMYTGLDAVGVDMQVRREPCLCYHGVSGDRFRLA